MTQPLVTVFGGTGFLGQRIVRRLADDGFGVRVAARRPQATAFPLPKHMPPPAVVDIRDSASVSAAVEGASAVVNAVSLYVERGDLSFESVHVDGAARVARCSHQAGVNTLVHISGIGASEDSSSRLIQCKARGEKALADEFSPAIIFRPSVLFGRDDAFVSAMKKATISPVVPLFGDGSTRLQPAWVQDVAQAVARMIPLAENRGRVFELGGAQVLSYREAVEAVCAVLGRKRLLLPVPFVAWKSLAGAMGMLPNPPLTIDQVQLLEFDNVVSAGQAGFSQLGIEPRAFADMLDHCLGRTTRDDPDKHNNSLKQG